MYSNGDNGANCVFDISTLGVLLAVPRDAAGSTLPQLPAAQTPAGDYTENFNLKESSANFTSPASS